MFKVAFELLKIFWIYLITIDRYNYLLITTSNIFLPISYEYYELGENDSFEYFFTWTVAYSRSRYPLLLIGAERGVFAILVTEYDLEYVSCGETKRMRTIYRQDAGYLYYPAVEDSLNVL